MRKSIFIPLLAAAAAVALGAIAQPREGYVTREPGRVGVAQTVKVTATITALDPAARTVTLTGPQGNELTVIAGPEVQNFNQLKRGDRVDVQYAEALLVELKKGGGNPVVRTEQSGMASAQPGGQPGVVGGSKVTVVGDVIALDAATQQVTVRGPQRTVSLNVRDPEQFKLIAKGDQLQATYVEAVAVDVRPAAAK